MCGRTLEPKCKKKNNCKNVTFTGQLQIEELIEL